jgi:polyhydroxyalkanoate synthase
LAQVRRALCVHDGRDVVSEPGHADRHYRVATKRSDAMYADPEVWLAKTPQKVGSWRPEWVGWLDANSGAPVTPPQMGSSALGYAPLGDAPGSYVLRA